MDAPAARLVRQARSGNRTGFWPFLQSRALECASYKGGRWVARPSMCKGPSKICVCSPTPGCSKWQICTREGPEPGPCHPNTPTLANERRLARRTVGAATTGKAQAGMGTSSPRAAPADNLALIFPDPLGEQSPLVELRGPPRAPELCRQGAPDCGPRYPDGTRNPEVCKPESQRWLLGGWFGQIDDDAGITRLFWACLRPFVRGSFP